MARGYARSGFAGELNPVLGSPDVDKEIVTLTVLGCWGVNIVDYIYIYRERERYRRYPFEYISQYNMWYLHIENTCSMNIFNIYIYICLLKLTSKPRGSCRLCHSFLHQPLHPITIPTQAVHWLVCQEAFAECETTVGLQRRQSSYTVWFSKEYVFVWCLYIYIWIWKCIRSVDIYIFAYIYI